MADIRIKDLPTTATQTASDDFIALDGTVNGTRKIDASAPSFKTSVTSPSVVAPAATALTLTGGSTGASLVLGQGTTAGDLTFTPTGSATAGTFLLSRRSASAATIATISYGADSSSLNQGPGYFFLGTNSAIPLVLGTTGVERARLTSTGNLLIGTTTDMTGSGGLKIAGTTAATTTTSGALIVAGGVGVSGALYTGGNITTTYAGSPALVAISTATPAATSTVYLGNTAGTAQAWTFGAGGSSAGAIGGVDVSRNFFIYDNTAGQTRLSIDTTGAATFAGIIKPQQATTAGAPAYVKGAIYFDTTLNKLRVGGATAWETITSV